MSTPVSVLTLRAPAWQRWGGGFGKFPPLAAAMLGALLLISIGGVAVAQSLEVNGELDVIIKEDFDHGRFEYDYFLRGEDGQDGYQLEFKQTPPGHLRSSQRVKVRGQPQGRKFQVESLDERGTATPLVAPLATGQVVDEHKTVVLMVDLTNAKASNRYTLAQIAGQMYANSLSVDGVYREASLGQMSFPADTDGNGQPDVFGPFAISYDNSTCDYYSWASAAETAAQAAGINLSLYTLPRYNL